MVALNYNLQQQYKKARQLEVLLKGNAITYIRSSLANNYQKQKKVRQKRQIK